MAANDRLLLDGLLASAAATYGNDRRPDEYLELLVFDQVLRDRLLSIDQLESGWVDGALDGGIDGFFIFIDDRLITEPALAGEVRRSADLSVHMFSVRHKDHFQEIPVNALLGSVDTLFDLGKEKEELQYNFSDEILDQRETFRATFINTAEKHPRVSIHIYYASRGDTAGINRSVRGRLAQVADNIRLLFSTATVTAEFLGAAELVAMSRRQRTSQRRLRFQTSLIADRGYILLVPLADYYQFVADESGSLARSLFESNVRDYVGESGINSDIETTLATGTESPDFWWLNNGVTMLASQATLTTPHELVIETPQIVNGLQTTEVIHRYFTKHVDRRSKESRSILVKVIVSPEDSARDRIVKATNYQNPVALAALRATDVVQKNIEQYLEKKGWYYDRRPGYHRNMGKPLDRIVSTSALGAAVWSLVYGNYSHIYKTKWMRRDDLYHKVFFEGMHLDVYRIAIELFRVGAHAARRYVSGGVRGKTLIRWEALFARALLCLRLGRLPATPMELLGIETGPIEQAEFAKIAGWINQHIPDNADPMDARVRARSMRSEVGRLAERLEKVGFGAFSSTKFD